MKKITAHIKGGNRQGPMKKFEIMDELPEAGELVDMHDPGYIWGEPMRVILDPEQRTGHDDEIMGYDFYKVPEISTDDPDEEPGLRWIAIRSEAADE